MTKLCKVCKTTNPNPLRKTCSYRCADKWLRSDEGIKATEKANKRVLAKMHRERKAEVKKDLSWWKKKAQRRFNQYIRERDKNKPCISCGAVNYKITAGHYKTVGGYPELRYHPMNAHGQCWWNCNKNKSGNIAEARKGIIKRYGVGVIEFLEGHHADKKYRIDDLRIIDKWFKRKIARIK